MAKTANELLQGILTTVSSIDQNMKQDQKKSETGRGGGKMKDAVNVSGALLKFSLVKPKTTERFITFMKDVMQVAKDSQGGKGFKVFSDGMIGISAALPDLVKGLSELSRIRSRRVDTALGTLRKLYMLMDEMGDGRKARKINRAIRLFDKMGKALRKIGAPLRILSNFLTYLGLSFVVFAAGIVASSAILKLASPMGILGAVLGTVLVLVGVLVLLTLAEKYIKPGLKTIKGIGKGLLFLSLGILGFTLSLLLVASAMQAGLGFGGIMKSLAVLGGVILAIVGMFALLGVAGKLIKKGVGVTIMMGIGLGIMAIGVGLLLTAAAGISNLIGAQQTDDKKVKFLGMEVPPYVKGLGAIGMIFLGAAGLFALMGLPGVNLAIGIGTGLAIAITGTLLFLAHTVTKLVTVSSNIPEDFGAKISGMIGGLLQGILGGISSLSGGKKGIAGLVEFGKNSAKIFAATGILMAASVSLSMFARALTAFANLSEMRPIIGHKENGEPIFGDKINVANVGTNISTTIHDFLVALISSTDGLSRQEAGAIKKMGKALTGRRGILSAVIGFADALKVYAEFGEKNEIGYMTYDDEGNEIRKFVPVDFVVDNMINSFLTFTNKLFTRSEEEFGDGEPGISGRQKRRMKRMSKALVGKNGILGAVMQFSETLQLFSKFGKDNQIPIMDDEGKPTGQFLSMDDIANNIVNALTSFSDTLATKLEKGKAKDAGKALNKYDDMIKKLNKLSTSMDGLSRMSADVKDLAENVGTLAVNLDKLNMNKLDAIMDKSIDASSRPVYANTGGGGLTPAASAVISSSSTSNNTSQQMDWDKVSQMIGEQVGSRVSSALKNGQFVFEFDTTKSGGIYYWKPS